MTTKVIGRKGVYAMMPELIWKLTSFEGEDEEARYAACELGWAYAQFLMGHRDKSPAGPQHFSIWQHQQIRTHVYLLAWHRKLIMPRRRNPIIERKITEGRIL